MNTGYNQRLFSFGLRRFFHTSRFLWLNKQVEQLNLPQSLSVLELGCFDAKTIDFLPRDVIHYEGYDANWENGLDIARSRFGVKKGFYFIESADLNTFKPQKRTFDISICMETLEHLPEREEEAYIEKLAYHTKCCSFFTIPNEKGIFFLIKFLYKRMINSFPEKYTLKEVFFATIGRLDKVRRRPLQHKGYDYEKSIKKISEHYDIIKIQGIPFSFLPKFANMTIGVVAKPK